jgi:hypothetical protein
MRPWEDNQLKKDDTVHDNHGERGCGVIVRLHPYGADINFERGGESFLGFHWIGRGRVGIDTLPDISDIPEI